MNEFATMREFDFENKTVLIRLDINSPMDPKTHKILDDTRIRAHIPTLKELEDAKVVVLAHQSRPGLEDFTTLKPHANRLRVLLGRNVEYIDEIFSSRVKKKIDELEKGDVLVLENVRFCSEEVSEYVIKKRAEEQINTHLVKKLSSYVDFYINDAFAVSHRNQPSVVAFPVVLPSCAGLLLEKEVKTLSYVLNFNESPRVYVFGGAKVKDTFKVIKNILEQDKAEYILTSGIVGNLFLLASGVDIGKENIKHIEKESALKLVDEAKKLLKEYKEKIFVPKDFAYLDNGRRREAGINSVDGKIIMDIGMQTIAEYTDIIKKAKLVVANGPAGVFEIEEFSLGTKEILRSMAKSNGFSIIGGGHLIALARKLKIVNKLSFISTAGKAMLLFLAGEKLSGLEVLRKYSKRRGIRNG